ncbi:hypothetical protein [Streptomyces sp. NPDC001530]|uniref:hypothetical protein n=1 Tax=Streptomyces sp. NPDC001530 TaxID=3364582 RepID=UPI003674D51F
MNVSVHIECLVLDGFDLSAGQRGDLRTSLRTSLAGAFAAAADPPYRAGVVDTLPAPAVPLDPGLPPRALGERLAQSLCTAISRPGPA